MATRIRMHPTLRQKKKLFELMAKHPELASKPTIDFNHKDMQRIWLDIANECNIIPGVKKTWRQWRKTWQDMKSNRKKRQLLSVESIKPAVTMISNKPTLDFKYVSSTTTNSQGATDFEPLHQEIENQIEINNGSITFGSETYYNASLSEPESPPEAKVFTLSQLESSNTSPKPNSEHSNNCLFNCNVLAVQEQKKLKLKEDYYNFKQEYFKQKLLLMKEQTDALKNIAKGLSNK